MEKKTLNFACDIKLDDNADDKFFIVEGLASTSDVDLVDDVVVDGAFSESIMQKKPKILYQHEHSQPIGVTDEIRYTNQGLFIKVKLPKDDDFVKGRVIPQIKIGTLDAFSIGFRYNSDGVEYRDGIRYITKADLHEVSIVTFPAQPNAKITGFKSDNNILEKFKKIQNDVFELNIKKIKKLITIKTRGV